MQAVSRAVKSVKSIMKVANDVSSVFIHGYTSEEKDSGTVTDEVPDSTTLSNVTANSSFISAGGEKVSDFTRCFEALTNASLKSPSFLSIMSFLRVRAFHAKNITAPEIP
jgi:hypothetical protein